MMGSFLRTSDISCEGSSVSDGPLESPAVSCVGGVLCAADDDAGLSRTE